jgi:hypothetical protein
MSQILHIFRKDSRRFWPEILVSLAVNGACVLFYLRQGVFPAFLVPMGWWLLIGRVVQAESLVGENQAWLTRPYEWKKLLAAKVLFLAAYLYLPLAIMQCLLLRMAGLPPAAHSTGLAYDWLLIGVVFVLPLFAIAAVTANFARMTLTLLGIILALIGLEQLSQFLLENWRALHLSGNLFSPVPAVAFALCFFGAVLMLQYATRRVWLSRWLLLGVPVVAIVVAASILFAPPNMDRAYPQPSASASAALHLSFADDVPGRNHRISVGQVSYGGKSAMALYIDFDESGVADGYAIQIDDVKFSIDGPAGFHWDSPWEARSGQRYLPGATQSSLQVSMSPAVYDRIKASTVQLHLTFALSRLQAGETANLRIPTGEFAVPGFGVCVAPQNGFSQKTDTSNGSEPRSFEFPMLEFSCRSALRQPPLTYIKAQARDGPRIPYQTDSSPTMPLETWQGNLDREPADLSISPIVTFVPWHATERRPEVRSDGSVVLHSLSLIPGTPMAFTPYHFVDGTRAEFTLSNVKIPD